MKDSYAANEEVSAVRSQLAKLKSSSLPADVATEATTLDTKLASFGGVIVRGGRGGFGGGVRAPGSILTFNTINGTFNTVLGPISQNGIDMPPTKAEVDTWESGCSEFTATLDAWKTMLGADVVNFNSLLTKNNLTPLKITQSAGMTVPVSCKFVWSADASGRRR